MENHHFIWENPLFLWWFSIATLNYQRVGGRWHIRATRPSARGLKINFITDRSIKRWNLEKIDIKKMSWNPIDFSEKYESGLPINDQIPTLRTPSTSTKRMVSTNDSGAASSMGAIFDFSCPGGLLLFREPNGWPESRTPVIFEPWLRESQGVTDGDRSGWSARFSDFSGWLAGKKRQKGQEGHEQCSRPSDVFLYWLVDRDVPWFS